MDGSWRREAARRSRHQLQRSGWRIGTLCAARPHQRPPQLSCWLCSSPLSTQRSALRASRLTRLPGRVDTTANNGPRARSLQHAQPRQPRRRMPACGWRLRGELLAMGLRWAPLRSQTLEGTLGWYISHPLGSSLFTRVSRAAPHLLPSRALQEVCSGPLSDGKQDGPDVICPSDCGHAA